MFLICSDLIINIILINFLNPRTILTSKIYDYQQNILPLIYYTKYLNSMNRQENNFRLEDVDPQFRPQIGQIVTACAVTPEEAYECLLLHSLSVQDSISALKTRMNNWSNSFQNQNCIAERGFVEEGQFDDSDQQYQPYFYYQLREGKKYFYEKYPVNLAFMQSKHQPNTRQTKIQDKLAIKLLEEIKDPSYVPNNEVSTLEEALCISYNHKIPILLLHTDLRHEIGSKIRNLFYTIDFKQKLESQFIYFGIYNQQYKLEKWLEPYLNLIQLLNSIIILRVNLYDDIEISAIISLSLENDIIRQEIRKVKAETICKTLDEKYIKYKHKQTIQGQNWRRPQSYKTKIKKKQEQKRLLSNQRIRRQQEQAYKELAVKAKQKPGQKNHQQEQQQSHKTEYRKKLQEKRQKIVEYSQGFSFKIRVPSGKSIYIIAPPTEIIQYLYDFIECKEENLGFENDCPRKFDLCFGYGSSAGLNDKRGQKIGEIFISGEFLLVRQLE